MQTGMPADMAIALLVQKAASLLCSVGCITTGENVPSRKGKTCQSVYILHVNAHVLVSVHICLCVCVCVFMCALVSELCVQTCVKCTYFCVCACAWLRGTEGQGGVQYLL
jgi:hypothetical protein